MQPRMSRRFWEGVATGSASTVLLALTLVEREWCEAVFHVDPDRGSGAFEWLLVAVFVAATLGGVLAALAEFARLAQHAESS
jgi:hypothetical protein